MNKTKVGVHRIEIRRKNDVRGGFVKSEFQSFGITGIDSVEVRDVYYLYGNLKREELEFIAGELFCDRVVEEYRFCEPEGFEILFNPGVSDPREESIKKAIADLGIEIFKAKTATNYLVKGNFDDEEMKRCAALFLYNPLIQHIKYGKESTYKPAPYKFHIQQIDLNTDLVKISRDMGLSLSKIEMEKIKEYFQHEGRQPTDVELETIAQTWSEHCRHKTFLGNIDFNGERIENLLKNTIMKATNELNKPFCLSVFHDNSGVIEFDEEYGVCFKVETHNHPSALEPYGGAATGIGGVIRDILGTGRGAKPILDTDVFCFGPPDFEYQKLPEGILHPQTIIKGVIRGVRDYGNRMGIPTASGTLYFDEDFLYNPLVYCGCVGLIRKDRIDKGAKRGDAVLLVGGKTGRDGIHGVTFASAELSEEAEKSCVQIGNPIVEKRVMDCLLRVSEEGLLNSVTDCGGGGLSSAVGEMGEETGVRVELDKVPLKYEGLSPREIWISESQERMILAVPRKDLSRVIEYFEKEGVDATVIGEFTGDKRLSLFYQGERVCDLDMKFLHKGIPMPLKKARLKKKPESVLDIPKPIEFNSLLLKIIGGLNSCSKEWVIREYDHEVQGGSVIKPLTGKGDFGPQDAVVIKPRFEKDRGIVVSCGINPGYGRLDAYNMALSVIDEALRNMVATGGDIEQAALLDNFCFSSPEREEVLGDIVMSARGCYDAAVSFGVPFISGKDSLYNEWSDNEGRVHLIPPTLLISAIGIIEDVKKCITMDLKEEGSELYLIGVTKEELGGSEYFKYLGIKGGKVPGVDLKAAPEIMRRLHRAIEQGLVLSCHDLSEGGLGLCIAEMAMSGDIGAEIDLDRVVYDGVKKRHDFILFSESNTRFLVEISREKAVEFKQIFNNIPHTRIGSAIKEKEVRIFSGTKELVRLPLSVIVTTWRREVCTR
ncbi:MAG TPA: phosphoribosylformylglycinamidine synthase subunit PurL [candidate division WOR-3 bacterium]|uniref:Phosphoribosylformylglycinamidine synthase subunit PurL n=1 Tax=candidate division WOR-3 bacterium TaxID=2052148 RepID=A0A9C9EP92_UNCW3|nr:phosphoribosylformylglycinamidine synthase subunit PurL [candidate division WOR-3 bacterium]